MISVIIPTLNEATLVSQAIRSAMAQNGVDEVIVVDGGSRDGTQDLAQEATTVLNSSPGRAIQMNLGARASRGDTLVFLHADSQLPPSYSLEVMQRLDDPRVVGGCAPISFDGQSVLLDTYSWLSRFPPRLLHYGDGALFVRRSAFDLAGGYREIPLMEDLAMIRDLRRIGEFALLESPVTTSRRRFQKGGSARTQVRNMVLVGLFLLGADPHHLKRFYPEVR